MVDKSAFIANLKPALDLSLKISEHKHLNVFY